MLFKTALIVCLAVSCSANVVYYVPGYQSGYQSGYPIAQSVGYPIAYAAPQSGRIQYYQNGLDGEILPYGQAMQNQQTRLDGEILPYAQAIQKQQTPDMTVNLPPNQQAQGQQQQQVVDVPQYTYIEAQPILTMHGQPQHVQHYGPVMAEQGPPLQLASPFYIRNYYHAYARPPSYLGRITTRATTTIAGSKWYRRIPTVKYDKKK